MNEDETIREAMRILGSRTSPRKKITSRLNAMKPRKKNKGKRKKRRKVAPPQEPAPTPEPVPTPEPTPAPEPPPPEEIPPATDPEFEAKKHLLA